MLRGCAGELFGFLLTVIGIVIVGTVLLVLCDLAASLIGFQPLY